MCSSQDAIMRRVLSIQSHVVHGYVGNKSATFPLQVLGFEVDAINSVQFSNHNGYKVIKGQVLQEKELIDLLDGLEENNLLNTYSHLLTGYIGNASFLRQIAEIVKKLRVLNPELIYVCDPVLGDNGRMYVPKDLLPIYRDEIIPLADTITPNQFEIELLTDIKIKTEADIWRAVDWFHARNVATVVISSSDLGTSSKVLQTFLSQRNGPRFSMDIPMQGDGEISFGGTGDLFAALFLAHSHCTNSLLGLALEKTTASLQAVISRTIESMPEDVRTKKRRATSRERELKLIQSKNDIENPKILIKAKRIF